MKGKYLRPFSFILIFTGMIFASPLAAHQNPNVHFDLQVRIEPDSGMMWVHSEIRNPPDTVFTLSKDLHIEKIEADGKAVDFKSISMAGSTAEIRFLANHPEKITIDYTGKIEKDTYPPIISLVNLINPELVELAIYVSWYPRFDRQRFNSTYHLEVDLPNEFTCINNGILENRKINKDRIITSWTAGTNAFDIVILAARNFKKFSYPDDSVSIEIYSENLPASYIDSIAVNLADVTKWYASLYGLNEQADLVRVAYSPRPGWGYVRIPLIIISEETVVSQMFQPFGQAEDFRYISHEIAHYWWHMASFNPDDWINEGLAEYSALIAAEKYYGKELYEKLLNDYKKKAGSGVTETAIAETENDSPDRELNRYTKPTLLFVKARDQYGDKKFFSFLQALYKRFEEENTATTSIFLDEVEKNLGYEARQFFTESLYKKTWTTKDGSK